MKAKKTISPESEKSIRDSKYEIPPKTNRKSIRYIRPNKLDKALVLLLPATEKFWTFLFSTGYTALSSLSIIFSVFLAPGIFVDMPMTHIIKGGNIIFILKGRYLTSLYMKISYGISMSIANITFVKNM